HPSCPGRLLNFDAHQSLRRLGTSIGSRRKIGDTPINRQPAAALGCWLTGRFRQDSIAPYSAFSARYFLTNGENTMGIIIWLIVGAIAGWLAGQVVRGGGVGRVGGT